MRHLYTLLIQLLRPIAMVVLLWKSRSNPAYRAAWRERLGFGDPLRSASSIWVHAVSLGEVAAAAGLVRALRLRFPQAGLILTTATPTGRARALALFGDAITVRYLPYDTPRSMRRFLTRAQPRLAVIMETELWPNLFRECRRRGIPVLLANARLSQQSVRRYRRFGALFRDVFQGGTVVAAQSAEDAERFMAIGAQRGRTHVMGNLKFDIEVDPAVARRGAELRSRCWGARPVWIAGSTHAGEEELVLDAHALLEAKVPGALLLLVPRHPERFAAVAGLLERGGFRFERRSSDNPLRADAQVLLVDTVGELSSLYASVDVAFVGGSLVPVGGHNLLEPAALGIPVITGPFQANAREIASLLLREGAALQVSGTRDLAATLRAMFTDTERRRQAGARGLQVIAANRGSLARLLALIVPLLEPAAVEPAAARP